MTARDAEFIARLGGGATHQADDGRACPPAAGRTKRDGSFSVCAPTGAAARTSLPDTPGGENKGEPDRHARTAPKCPRGAWTDERARGLSVSERLDGRQTRAHQLVIHGDERLLQLEEVALDASTGFLLRMPTHRQQGQAEQDGQQRKAPPVEKHEQGGDERERPQARDARNRNRHTPNREARPRQDSAQCHRPASQKTANQPGPTHAAPRFQCHLFFRRADHAQPRVRPRGRPLFSAGSFTGPARGFRCLRS